MTATLATLLFAALSFIFTFAAARAMRKWFMKRREEKDAELAMKTQSRQVRRARERKSRDRV